MHVYVCIYMYTHSNGHCFVPLYEVDHPTLSIFGTSGLHSLNSRPLASCTAEPS